MLISTGASSTYYIVIAMDIYEDIPIVARKPVAPVKIQKNTEADVETGDQDFIDVTDTLRQSNENIAEDVQKLIDSNNVLLFAKSNDHFSIEVERTLLSWGVTFAIVELDKLSPKVAKDTLATLSSIALLNTAPHLFIDGISRGGCSAIKEQERIFELQVLLAKYIQWDRVQAWQEARVRSLGFLHHPDTENALASRAAAGVIALYSLLCMSYSTETATPWIILGLAIDCVFRLVGGLRVSIAGMIGEVLVSYLPPEHIAGPTKQFAAGCYSFFTVFAAGLALGGYSMGGLIMLALLAVIPLIECFTGICLFSLLYEFFYRIGWVRNDVFRPHFNRRPDLKWYFDFTHTKRDAVPPVEARHVYLSGQDSETPVDLIRKNRFETEYKLQDVHVFKHTRIDLFLVPMGILALAYAFQVLDNTYRNALGRKTLFWGVGDVAGSLGIIATVFFITLIVLYGGKIILYKKKVYKEWQHPISGNLFTSIPICLSLFGLLMFNTYLDFGITLVWIAAILQMKISILRISNLIYDYHADDSISPSLLLIPIGNYITSLALATYPNNVDLKPRGLIGGVNYGYLARFWFAVASLFAITLFIITFKRSFSETHGDTRHRGYIWLWMATSAIASTTYVSLNNLLFTVESDVYFQSLWLITVFFLAINVVGLLRGFYTFTTDISNNWILTFSASLVAVNTAQYYANTLDTFTRVLLLFSLSFACYLCAISFLYTTLNTFNLTIFKPRSKFSPATFLKLVHEAFRFAIPQLKNAVGSLTADNPFLARVLVNDLEPFLRTFREHSRHEEVVILPLASSYFPGVGSSEEEEHRNIEQRLDDLLRWMFVLKTAPPSLRPTDEVTEAVEELRTHLPSWCDEVLDHLRNEENTSSVVIRKYVPIQRQREALKRCYNLTSTEDWHVILPYLVQKLAPPEWKLSLVRSLVWAMPDRAHEIGLILYRNTDSVMWAFLTSEVPAIIPRGLEGYKKIY